MHLPQARPTGVTLARRPLLYPIPRLRVVTTPWSAPRRRMGVVAPVELSGTVRRPDLTRNLVAA
jgi:hypothetical protein